MKVANKTRKKLSQQQRLRRSLKMRIRVMSRFDIEPLPEGRERHTCRKCGDVSVIDPYAKLSRRPDPYLMRKLQKYRANDGVSGICKECSRKRANELYG